MQALEANMTKRKQSLTCNKKDEISHGLHNHLQPVRHETTLKEGLPCGQKQWRTTGDNKGAHSRSENAKYLCDKNR